VARVLLSRTIAVSLASLSVLQLLQSPRQASAGTDDFAFLRPWFTVEKEDRDTLARGGVVVHALPASSQQIGVAATCAVEISPDALVALVRSLGNVRRGELVAGRFDEPPVIKDLTPLSLDQGDIDRLRLCRPGDCALNLSDQEMSGLQSSVDVQGAFRQVVLDRLLRYHSGGLGALPEYHDRPRPVRPAVVFSEILQQTPYLQAHVPAVAKYLERFPSGEVPVASSFHWSKVTMNNKPVVMVEHLATFRPDPGQGVPAVLVAGKQVYASRYMNGELTLWMLFARGDALPTYLVYVMRSQLDELSGALSGVKRTAFEGRIKEEAAGALAILRDRLESRP
jgi:hypothetical protein